MRRVRFIHWNAAEARERAKRLRAAGYQVQHRVPSGLDFMRDLRGNPPNAVVIDLTRLPSQGRDVGLAIRHAQATRRIPLVFVAGAPEKVAMVRQSLPDAVYTGWETVRSAIKRAMAHPPVAPTVPESVLAGYAGRPLSRKLGIKPNSILGLVNAPADFRAILGALPAGVVIREVRRSRCDLIVWFVRTRRALQDGIEAISAHVGSGGLWIAWRKGSSGAAGSPTQLDVRRVGLAAGLVDYKIVAIDATWSGLLFTRRK